MGETEDERSSQASQLFENFVQASTCKGTLQAFGLLCRQLELDPADHQGFYSSLKAAVTSWKAKALWTKLDKRANHKEYKKGKACSDLRVGHEIKTLKMNGSDETFFPVTASKASINQLNSSTGIQ